MVRWALPFRSRAFVEIGSLSSRLPPFRGRTRIFLELYRLLGLRKHHVRVVTTLRRPAPFKVQLDLHSWLQRIAFLTGQYEDATVSFLLRLHAAGGGTGYLLDVGANVGLIAVPFAMLVDGPTPTVVAIEAVPDNVQALRTNLALNDILEKVVVIPAALGETSKIVSINVEGDLRAGEGTGTANILPDWSGYECVRQQIRIKPLDGLAAAGVIPRGCSVMKIDADGYDLNILRGSTAFLLRDRPVIFGEFDAHCLGWHRQTLDDVVATARELRYEVYQRVAPHEWQFSRALSIQHFIQDLLLVPEERWEQFQSFTH